MGTSLILPLPDHAQAPTGPGCEKRALHSHHFINISESTTRTTGKKQSRMADYVDGFGFPLMMRKMHVCSEQMINWSRKCCTSVLVQGQSQEYKRKCTSISLKRTYIQGIAQWGWYGLHSVKWPVRVLSFPRNCDRRGQWEGEIEVLGLQFVFAPVFFFF